MHPIERLRMVARAGREDSTLLAREAASALASVAGQPAALVTACRRLVDRQPTCGPVWWVAARVLSASDPAAEAWRAGDELVDDPTPAVLADALADDVVVAVLGWPEQVAEALVRRGDARVFVVDALDEGGHLAGWLRQAGGDSTLVPESGVAAAVAASGLVLLDAAALGPEAVDGVRATQAGEGTQAQATQAGEDALAQATQAGLVAVAGSAAAAAVAHQLGVPVWAVAGVGRVLPGPLWQALAEGLATRGPAWFRQEEIVPLAWVDTVVGPSGVVPAAEASMRPTCPPAPELTLPRRAHG